MHGDEAPADGAAQDGNVVCWGDDFYGQATPPDAVNGVSGAATDIAAGAWHSCAIQAGTGNAVCWGNDDYGQSTPPDEVNGVSGTATDIAAGTDHTLAIWVPEPTAWLAQPAGLALLCALHRSRARKRRRLTVPL
jgi:alpha-tubulin suppressor-like RCC1 family protein